MLLYTAQPKIDTKGHAYTLALQQILTGVYIAELCLIGLFGLRSATGPALMLAVLLLLTIASNILMNRHFAPLEQYLPADLALESDSNGEQEPLLSSAEEGASTALSREESRISALSNRTHVPTRVVGPLARFFEPHIFASYTAMRAWLQDGDYDSSIPQYSDEAVRKAYINPAYTNAAPLVWIPRDSMGVSKREISANKDKELKCSDDGAWIDEEGNLKWSMYDFEQVPIFKKGTKW
jgi:hypothetical protein